HVVNATNTPLDFLNDHLHEFPKEQTFLLHCAAGYRSIIAASILKSRGFHNLIDITEGFKAIKNAGIEVTNYVCPTTL
ncbi:MAG: rhodanese-like domain-containing protein, partial [Maribacter sp.]|nr:rhodanese-like domain-containing protein [Maribacter sp.]